jgi:hypothetical protein
MIMHSAVIMEFSGIMESSGIMTVEAPRAARGR